MGPVVHALIFSETGDRPRFQCYDVPEGDQKQNIAIDSAGYLGGAAEPVTKIQPVFWRETQDRILVLEDRRSDPIRLFLHLAFTSNPVKSAMLVSKMRQTR